MYSYVMNIACSANIIIATPGRLGDLLHRTSDGCDLPASVKALVGDFLEDPLKPVVTETAAMISHLSNERADIPGRGS